MFSSSPSNTPGRVASPVFHQSPTNKPVTPDYSAFSALQQSFSTSRTVQSYNPPPTYVAPQTSRNMPSVSVDDDFGTFSSAVQDTSTNSVDLCNSSNLNIHLEPSRSQQTNTIILTARFTNKQSVPLDEVAFQMAVPKVPPPRWSKLILVEEIKYESTVFQDSWTVGERWDYTNLEYYWDTCWYTDC
jgi:hypothetical protein